MMGRFRTRLCRRSMVAVAAILSTAATSASAELVTYLGAPGWQAWQQASPGFSTIDFTDLEDLEPVASDRYAAQGVVLTDWDQNYGWLSPQGFPIDDRGIFGGCTLEFTFTSPVMAVGVHFPGGVTATIFAGETLLATIDAGTSGANHFLGVWSSETFDRIRLVRPFPPSPPQPCQGIFADNIYFLPIPGPGGVATLLLGGLMLGGRRRRA